MKKNLVLVLVMVVLLTGGAFAQEESKHQQFDVLIGLNFGLGITPSMFEASNGPEEAKIPKGNYAVICDFGITGDFYLFNWLSVNTGLLLHPGEYLFLDHDLRGYGILDVVAAPLCLTIPISAHVNIPKAEWLYAGIGLSLNIPLFSMVDSATGSEIYIDTKSDFFIGLPIDLGFDFIKPDKGGARFFFRITPEFHKKGTVVPIGFIWQIWNWKVK
jgi:hypothetical protein